MSTSITAGIIDDEHNGREYIELLLANEFPHIEVLFTAASVAEAFAFLEQQLPDLLFLDVELGDGTVFDVLGKTDLKNVQLIFTTAYDRYAIRAIKNDAADYLLKPIRPEEFVLAVEKAIHKMHERQHIQVPAVPVVQLPTRNGIRKTLLSEIIRCEADSNYTVIYLTDKQKIVVSKTLQEFEKQFEAHGFVRIHHKHLINMAHFAEYLKGKGGLVVLTDGTQVPVSLRRKAEFAQSLKQLRSGT